MENLDLAHIASRLEALEETIIFALIERIQFALNPDCYRPGKSGFSGRERESLFDLRLTAHETMDARFGRYLTAEERPVTADLPGSERRRAAGGGALKIDSFDRVNLSGRLRDAYLDFLPRICAEGDDGQYGSSIERDVICLQALIRRVHFAAFYVAESKYRDRPDRYRERIAAGDRAAVEALLTRPEVEARILERVAAKSRRLQEISDFSLRRILAPAAVTELYRDIIIPLTKQGEVDYLFARG